MEASRVAADPSRSLRQLHMEMVDAVLGREGLGGVARLAADAAGAPIAIVAPRLGGPWLVPDERLSHAELATLGAQLLEYASDRSRGGAPAELVHGEPIAIGSEVAGIVALLRDGRATAPAPYTTEIVHLAAMAALTGAAVAEARHDAERKLRGSLLQKLRGADELDAEELVREAALLGCELADGAVALCAELPAERAARVLAVIAGESPGALAEYDEPVAGEQTRRLYALVPATRARTAQATLVLARRLAVRLGRSGTVGMSSSCAAPGELARAVGEAELMLEMVVQSGAPIACEVDRSSGTYRLLFRVLSSHPEEVHLLYDDTVAPLVGYDGQYATDLVTTLQTYLANNCNMNATAGAIFAHRHTVAYRLERIRELTGLDPARSEDRERLGLGLKAYRMIRTKLPR